jgi:hypothetical protein
MAGHASAAHDDDVGAVLLHELAADGLHVGERAAACRLGDAHAERTLARKARRGPHLPQVALVACGRRREDRDNAEAVGTVATSSAVFAADVATDGETIAAIGRDLPAGAKEIDARGKLVLPGAWTAIAISSSSRLPAFSTRIRSRAPRCRRRSAARRR